MRRPPRPGIRRLMGPDLLRRGTLAAELEDELQFHLEARAEQLMRAGLSRDDAMARARDRYGALDLTRRDIRRHARRRHQRMTFSHAIETLAQDVRFAVRTLARQPAWTAVAVLTLALGIGANTAVFSVVNDLLLDPLRYPHADRLVTISRVHRKSGIEMSPTRELGDGWKNATAFDGIFGAASEEVTLSGDGDPRTVRRTMVDPGFFAFTGARIILGRAFRDDEAKAGAAPVGLLGEATWREHYGSSPAVLGQTITLDGEKRTIIGIVGDGLRILSYSSERTDIWAPLVPSVPFLSGPAVGRLRQGVTIEAAQKELQALSDHLAASQGSVSGLSFEISVRRPGSSGQARQSVLMLAGAVMLLLMIACANVAHLLLARGAAREREMAIRAALGAGRGRIVRQLLTESSLLAAAGCVVGIALGILGLRLIVALRPERMGGLANVQVDGRVVVVTVVLSVITGVFFGITAALHGSRGTAFGTLRTATGGTADRSRQRVRSLLVVTEMALSVVLLVGATLFIRTMINLYKVDPGFDATDLYAVRLTLPESRYPRAEDRDAFAARVLDAAQRVPGLANSTMAANVPTRAGVIVGVWEIEGERVSGESRPPASGFTAMNNVRSEYFSLMRMSMIGGRGFDAASSRRHEVVISTALARQLWGSTDVINRRFRMTSTKPSPDGPGEWSVVVGVVGDAALLALHDERDTPAVYFPSEHGTGFSTATLIVRARHGQAPGAAIRRLLLAVDPSAPPATTLSVSDLLMKTISSQRFMMTLLTVFAALAVCLSAIGLYGVIAYMVGQRTREIGVRIALGATHGDIRRLILSYGGALAFAGLALGLIGAVAGSRVLRGSLYGVTPTDPTSYALGAVALLAIAAAACIAPTRRAVRVDPVVAMRGD